MKLWLKLLIGSILGMIIGFLLPSESHAVHSTFEWLEKLALGMGRYTVVPVLIFSLTIAVYELRMDGQFWPMIFKNFLLIIGVSILVIFLGITVTVLFTPEKIDMGKTFIQIENMNLTPAANILEIFPSNMLSVLAKDGIYLFPFCVFAFFLGMGLNYDRNYSKPVISMVDSLSRIFYHIASFFSEILGFILIVLSAYWAIRFNIILKSNEFSDFIIMLFIFSIVLCFGILPLFLYFLTPKVNPWRVLYGFLGPAITAFISGDMNFTIPVIMRHSKENFGIRRRSSSLSVFLFSAFCRCGSSMVAASAFIVILSSNYQTISIFALISIGVFALVISFLLASHPGRGAFIALAALCSFYDNGFYGSNYLYLRPMAFYLIAIGTFIDVMLNAFGTYVLAHTNGFIEEKNLVHFI